VNHDRVDKAGEDNGIGNITTKTAILWVKRIKGGSAGRWVKLAQFSFFIDHLR